MTLPTLTIRRRRERRLQRGHPWVFSNEVAIDRSPLTGFEPGECVTVLTHSGRALGTAYVNPNSLICARMVSDAPDRPLDAAIVHERIARAIALRETLGWLPDCRLVYGESDWLPGLVVDRYGDVLSVQIGTAGMERMRDHVLDALQALCAPAAVVMRNDLTSRELEGLDRGVEVVRGEAPGAVRIEENGAVFEVAPAAGQKTGWYYDQRANRARFARHARGRDVLDAFSYLGGFGVQAALGGAASVLCLDASESALAGVARNAALNGVNASLDTRRGDVFDSLRELRDDGRRFGLVCVDPPAFMRRRKDRRSGLEAYRRLNRRALQVLADDGLLLSASCSYHLDAGEHQEMIAGAGADVGCRLQILERGHQAADHPVHPRLPESEYLKALLVRAIRD